MSTVISALPLEGAGAAPHDEAALVDAARQQPAAFGVLYGRYRDRVYWYLRARTTHDEDAADLTQQVFLHALGALPHYRPHKGPFAAWLFGIARNAATNLHTRHRTTVTWDLVPAALQPACEHDPEAGALRQETIDHLRALFSTLPPEKRELLVLRFVARLTVGEIAAVIGKSEAATRKSLSRTLHALKEHYDDTSL